VIRHASRLHALLLLAPLAACGCGTQLQLATRPFEAKGPLSRVRPTKVRIIVPPRADTGKTDTNIPAQESWTCLLALALAANGHEVAIGGPMPPALPDLASAAGLNPRAVYLDRGDSDLTIEVKSHAVALYKVDFPYGDHMGEAILLVEIRSARDVGKTLIRAYQAHMMVRGGAAGVKEAQQWCVWDLTRDPEVVNALARAAIE